MFFELLVVEVVGRIIRKIYSFFMIGFDVFSIFASRGDWNPHPFAL